MGSEYAASTVSPHARVRCVECHVSAGARWYLRSKFNGVRQLYAFVRGSYPRLIPVPIPNLRPATDTCHTCHWPEKNFGFVAKRYVYFLADEQNTRWETDMEFYGGGGRPGSPLVGGIHWHMQVDNLVEYIASDEARSTIPWVRATKRSTGETVVYRAADVPEQPPAGALWRSMDCIACHNRPAHVFHTPRHAGNAALAAGTLDPRLPSLKQVAIDVLTAEYPSTDAALEALETQLRAFYEEHFPEVAQRERETIDRAVAELRRIYRENIFPEMKVRWDVYPNHASHLYTPGCFRCHDGQHVATDGRTIRSDCRLCHVVRAHGPSARKQYANIAEGLDFAHPADVGSDWKDSPCHECHSGAVP